MTRINFPPDTHRLIAQRAGYRCSLPTCHRHTLGPAPTPDQTTNSGVASHIFSASPSGPRGQGGLSSDELALPQNGIWLCAEHARVVDANRGAGYPPEVLLSYRDLHEARMMREVHGLYSPLGWVHEIEILEGPIFNPGQRVRLAKLNLLFGENATGKTALQEWLRGCFDLNALSRWRTEWTGRLRLRISYLDPQPVKVELDLSGPDSINYRIDDKAAAYNPLRIRFVSLTDRRVYGEADERLMLAKLLEVDPVIVDNLIEEIQAFPHAKIRNVRFEREDGTSKLLLDMDGVRKSGAPLRVLSGREKERVLIEFATALARLSGRYVPTILVLDTPFILFDRWFDFYSHHLLDPGNQFQTLMCIPAPDLDLDAIGWKGWEVIRTDRQGERVRLSQQIRGLGKTDTNSP